MLRIAAALSLSCLVAVSALADSVVPSSKVQSRVMVRAEGSRASRVVGSLRPGERALHLADEAGWRRVRLANGTIGWVSAAWTERVAERVADAIPDEPVDLAAIAKPEYSFFSAVAGFFRRLFLRGPLVAFDIRDPDLRAQVYRHRDPNLPVSGFVYTPGGSRLFDVVLAIDASTSTNEFAKTDVNHDGAEDDDWKGRDSIFKAQLSAAANLVRVLDRLPENEGTRRVRVGIVTYAGEESHRLDPADRHLPLSFDAIYAQAERDARVVLPLTSDYASVLGVLETMWSQTPIGMTNVAAGIGRAVVELNGDVARGARSAPRPHAEKIILFLSDGKPRLPYDKIPAERLAMYAGKLASESGIRVNAFALGFDPVTRSKNYSLKRMSRRTGGRYVALARPGEIATALGTTPFSHVETVQLRNRTTSRDSPAVATGIDGSFYGEVALRAGRNEIEIAATLDDGRRAAERFDVDYVPGRPTQELEEQLKRLRVENAALIEQIRDALVAEMNDHVQRRRLELRVSDDGS